MMIRSRTGIPSVRKPTLLSQGRQSLPVDQRFYTSGRGAHPLKEIFSYGSGRQAMRDPRRDIDFPRFHQFDDALLFLSCCVAAAQECQFPAMESRVMKCDVTGKQANEDELATVRNILERLQHGFSTTGAIKNGGG